MVLGKEVSEQILEVEEPQNHTKLGLFTIFSWENESHDI